MIEILISIFVLIGGFFSLLGSIGILRLKDVYGRIHAATKSATLGVVATITGTFLYFLIIDGEFSGNILLTILFVFMTAPVAAHIISRSAHRTGIKLWEQSTVDELVDTYPEKERQLHQQAEKTERS
ncbi:multisubunit sodium/proton antiporter MrpG subunit [Salsuginibacillus halophilus]|uniref:Multisubunit sodium/proton antiporter MrpG subunit n=1 Tax=Salsuginibacillus halophilus TaxID=517424 RepID=A0A2P8HFS4_9BACI|nr:monovalent cation/H(+) antiporter subunit G [Salsuginibacillus halophilus]PSL45066.1 multisubunit sodium/proton antiporter MrpG subunit [Salsuginibacillus halophilus]